MATRCCIPPESWYGMCLREVAELDEVEHLACARFARYALSVPRISSGSLTLSSTVRQSNSTGAWNTIP